MSANEELNPELVDWDVIVVGTGMGGGPLGYALARAGKRVLFVERGYSHLGLSQNPTAGRYPEEIWDLAAEPGVEYGKRLLTAGRYPAMVEDATSARSSRFVPHIGCGIGGSSALYGMVLERLFPSDFTPGQQFGEIGESTLPDNWPIDYDALAPWYAEAEQLFMVRGAPDPLRPDAGGNLLPPATLTHANRDLFAFLTGRGLHPYQLHIGCQSVPECATCQSYLCPRECKNDAGRICVAPAVSRYDAALLDECTVVRLEASRTAVDALVCHWRGRTVRLRGKIVVLAAGALATPGILLNSKSADWPHGVANTSHMVGRNLMRHLLDLYVIALPFSGTIKGQIKEIGFNDFYHFKGRKYGNVQSFGPLPSMRYLLNRPAPNLQRRLLRHAMALATPPWERFRHRRLVLASILEDLPYAENRVLPATSANGVSRIKFQYTIHPHERRRQSEFRAALADALKPSSFFRMRADSNTMLAHVCGTCRFGADPTTSVLDATNRAHDLSNLYICDSSFFPSSAGINPALTVAANALRVAAHMRSRL